MAKNGGLERYVPALLAGIFLVAVAVVAIFAFLATPLSGCIGVVQVKGTIVSDNIPPSLFSDGIRGGESIAEDIEEAGKRSDIRALLVMIDSPGGSAVASKRIYDALRSVNKTKVAYINEIATSGGYYVAAGTDHIVANPGSITGNIGARATLADLSGLFEKIGYNETTVKSGDLKDMGTYSRPLTDEERAIFESIVNESFEDFKAAVIEGRGSRLDPQGFQTALDARIMSGRQAQKIGLVDTLGNRKDAIRTAATLAGMDADEPRLCGISSGSASRGLFGSLSSESLEILLRGTGIPSLLYQ